MLNVFLFFTRNNKELFRVNANLTTTIKYRTYTYRLSSLEEKFYFWVIEEKINTNIAFSVSLP